MADLISDQQSLYRYFIVELSGFTRIEPNFRRFEFHNLTPTDINVSMVVDIVALTGTKCPTYH